MLGCVPILEVHIEQILLLSPLPPAPQGVSEESCTGHPVSRGAWLTEKSQESEPRGGHETLGEPVTSLPPSIIS